MPVEIFLRISSSIKIQKVYIENTKVENQWDITPIELFSLKILNLKELPIFSKQCWKHCKSAQTL